MKAGSDANSPTDQALVGGHKQKHHGTLKAEIIENLSETAERL